MRPVLIAGLAAMLAAPALAQVREIPPAEEMPPPAEAPSAPRVGPPDQAPPTQVEPAVPEDRARPAEGVPADATAPDVSPWGDKLRPPEPEPKPKPKVKYDEAAGGMAGSLAAKVAGTAVAGPVGGIAASFVGGPVGSATVRVGKRMLGMGHKPGDAPTAQTADAARAPSAGDHGAPVSAVEHEPSDPGQRAIRPEEREEPPPAANRAAEPPPIPADDPPPR